MLMTEANETRFGITIAFYITIETCPRSACNQRLMKNCRNLQKFLHSVKTCSSFRVYFIRRMVVLFYLQILFEIKFYGFFFIAYAKEFVSIIKQMFDMCDGRNVSQDICIQPKAHNQFAFWTENEELMRLNSNNKLTGMRREILCRLAPHRDLRKCFVRILQRSESRPCVRRQQRLMPY